VSEGNAVVMIAYYFPPDGGAAVYRPLRFVRRLTRMGWHCTVITQTGRSHDRYDPGLLESVPRDVEIVKVADRDIWQAIQARRARRFESRMAAGVARAESQAAHQRPLRAFVRSAVHRAEAWLYYPDPARFWIRPATEATVISCQKKRPKALIATGGPWSSFVVAHNASRRTGVPYVLDLRDSWTLVRNEDFEALRPRWAMLRDRRLLRKLFEGAQAVICRYESEAESYWQAYPGAFKSTNIHIIPNGYEGVVERFDVAPGDRCTILYTGTIVPYRYLECLEALSLLQKSFPAEARYLRVQFVGEGADNVQRAAASRGLTEIVETWGPVPSREVERLHRNAHGLLLLGVRPYQGYELCGSKVFGYLKAGRPIVGILPMDESRRVLERVGVSTVAGMDSPGEIVALLRRILASWSANALPALLPDPDRCAMYEAANQTSALVRALEGRPALSPFVPGSVQMPDSLEGKIGCQGWLSTAQ
jgi:glycosyltransferase involved in cell wall biosynthesis